MISFRTRQSLELSRRECHTGEICLFTVSALPRRLRGRARPHTVLYPLLHRRVVHQPSVELRERPVRQAVSRRG